MYNVKSKLLLPPMIIWQGIVGDPGERGAAGEKGKPVCIQYNYNDMNIMYFF